jgi:hypothetical protein
MDRAYTDTNETDYSFGTLESVFHPGGCLPKKVPLHNLRRLVKAPLRNPSIFSPA